MATTADTLAQEAASNYTDAKQLATDALNKTDQSLTAATDAVAGLWSAGYGGISSPTDVAPADIAAPVIPSGDLSADIKNAFDHAFGTLNATIQPQIENYLTAFFPDIAAAVKTSSDQWIIDTIANGRFVPANVESAIWTRAKDREAQEAARAEQDVISAAASRGFSAPPGAVNATIAAINENLAIRSNAINRDIAIKVFDVANDNAKFAIQQAVALRTAFVAALGDFIRTAMAQPNGATEYAKLMLQSKTSLYDSAIRLYATQIDEERMRTGVLMGNVEKDMQAHEFNRLAWKDTHDINQQRARIQADTAIAAAEQLGRIAAAAYATRNSVVSVSAGV